MSRNIETVNNYLDGFLRNDHKQIPSLQRTVRFAAPR